MHEDLPNNAGRVRHNEVKAVLVRNYQVEAIFVRHNEVEADGMNMPGRSFSVEWVYFQSPSSCQFSGNPISFACSNGQDSIKILSLSRNFESGLIKFITYVMHDKVA